MSSAASGAAASPLPDHVAAFLTERHLATLTTNRADGGPHVVPVGFTVDGIAGIARVITSDGTQKVVNVERDPALVVALCQVDGGRWLTVEGRARINRDPGAIADAVARYTARYRSPGENPKRVVIEIALERIIGRVGDERVRIVRRSVV